MSNTNATAGHDSKLRRIDGKNLVPLSVTVGAVGVALAAAVTWAQDRGEVYATAKWRDEAESRLRAVEGAVIEQTTLQRGILDSLRRIERQNSGRATP